MQIYNASFLKTNENEKSVPLNDIFYTNRKILNLVTANRADWLSIFIAFFWMVERP